MNFFRIAAIALLLMYACNTSASDMLSVVAGKVSDFDTGESLPFTKVRIKNTSRVSTANQDGLFTILNVPVGSTLVITKMGFESREIRVYPDTQRLSINLARFWSTRNQYCSEETNGDLAFHLISLIRSGQNSVSKSV